MWANELWVQSTEMVVKTALSRLLRFLAIHTTPQRFFDLPASLNSVALARPASKQLRHDANTRILHFLVRAAHAQFWEWRKSDNFFFNHASLIRGFKVAADLRSLLVLCEMRGTR